MSIKDYAQCLGHSKHSVNGTLIIVSVVIPPSHPSLPDFLTIGKESRLG